ncbi:nucleoside/nucleotide kinase family protein [Xenophilus arseniciresistens]|uniref:Nucleoside/nucleotide kinase family protein n=1 Tax=Xenophilus arseniciresistens TaxID=1283306 RepID=A0AAE3NAR7_9BURK|nr:nucleoside/nucleotide kinase family protein [Xenophilus arseniciresistens]MDA7418900.1 nucleoside/nucleotide kinase family protein [Xenophilus arseniciresistens]
MSSSPLPALPSDALARIDALLAPGRRVLLGLAGAPGSGKSTLAEALCAHYGPRAQGLPMDGFHLAQAELQRLGRAARKGAPDTFDAQGYVALLARVRAQGPLDGPVYAPAFRREIEEPVAGAIPIHAQAQLIVTEGNYLLFDTEGWAGVRPLLDACWYVAGDEDLRRARLVARHRQFGRSAEAAEAWVAGTDEPNAVRIAATRERADHVFCWSG